MQEKYELEKAHIWDPYGLDHMGSSIYMGPIWVNPRLCFRKKKNFTHFYTNDYKSPVPDHMMDKLLHIRTIIFFFLFYFFFHAYMYNQDALKIQASFVIIGFFFWAGLVL